MTYVHPNAMTLPKLLAKTERVGECLVWTGLKNPWGYGKTSIFGKSISTHRAAFRLTYGYLPGKGMQLDHLCRNRACVNVAHLEPVTGRENKLRGNTLNALNASKTHCPRNHPYDDENTYIAKDGSRKCRPCRVLAVANWRARKKWRITHPDEEEGYMADVVEEGLAA